MAPEAIVEALNVGKNIGSSSGPGEIVLVIDPLRFEAGKERLHGRVVVTVAGPAHASHDLMLGQEGLIIMAGVLAAAVGMMEQTGRWPAGEEGHLQSIDGQLAVQAVAEGPANDPTREHIQDGCQIQPALSGWDVSDVNGLITKDKFCMSRYSRLKLNWSRYEVYLQRKAKLEQQTPLDEQYHQGGGDEATMANSTTGKPVIGRTTALGSSLPADPTVEPMPTTQPKSSSGADQ